MQHQDWNQVVFTKKQNIPHKHVELSNTVKLDNDFDNLQHKRVSLSLAKQIQQARIKKGFSSQKQLAVAINVKPEIINHYENGTAIPNNIILQKLRKTLNCSFSV